ncbi:hypothetical protein Asppvi_009950 [Aspergillus pseudoviridinutans]|uniref:Uncharacterized protein n=1 Tax=Aspergillus pseudoviridinutans TaxID=1517512 RepID=A0A9P3EZM1_9EURO|nr:uncharacterized protein Asppvi_009950 [Aspergillus pseudoviridinutans]GIJ90985.1 hypothetical protein Asppvi_009950 [Aspergillus pseudoviridinutans]
MAPNKQPKICLDVAVDHRIRRLFKPVSDDLTEPSNHVSHIEARGLSLKRSHSEIQVTSQLAGPAMKGGIAVVLQQPRHNHPFEEGLSAVIDNCETLYALDDIFSAVSCESLSIRTNITVVDLLSYMSEDIASIGDEILRESFRASAHIILDKEPSILLCAGKFWLPNGRGFDGPKGDAWKFESIGVGKKFGISSKAPVQLRIRHRERGFVAIHRINGFHPSYAMNYHPHVSILRQLQILIGAETCAMLRGDWEDEEWMDKLRRRCHDFSKEQAESPNQSSRPQSPGESTIRRNGAKYLPWYQELYSEKLDSIHNCVQSLISESTLAITSSTELYEALLTSGLSEICNDATLILHQMSRLQHEGWPDSVGWKNKAALKEAASDTVRFTKGLLKATESGKATQFAKIIQEGASYVLRSILTSVGGRRLQYELDLEQASAAFLRIAMNIEHYSWISY